MNPRYVAFQVLWGIGVVPCRRPKGKYGSLKGLGYASGGGFELYTMCEWNEKLLLFALAWEDGDAVEWEPAYYSSSARSELKRIAKRSKAGKSVPKYLPRLTVRLGHPVFVASMPVAQAKKIVAEERAKLQAQLAALPA